MESPEEINPEKVARLNAIKHSISTPKGGNGEAEAGGSKYPKTVSDLPGGIGNAASSSGTPVTMEAMSALLISQLAPITGSVNRLETELHEFKAKVCSDIGEAKQISNHLKDDSENVKIRITKFEQRKSDETLAKKVEDIEKAIIELKLTPATGNSDTDETTARVGGMEGASSAEAAKTWLKDTMNKANIEGVLDVYDKCKGGDFNGMIFVKFSSSEKREAATKQFNDVQSIFSETCKFMNKDLPSQQRTKFSFLLSLKKLLSEWGFKNVQFNDASSILSVAKVPKLQATVECSTFNLVWIDNEWGQWKELTEDTKFNEFKAAADAKLKKAAESSQKGKGKASSA